MFSLNFTELFLKFVMLTVTLTYFTPSEIGRYSIFLVCLTLVQVLTMCASKAIVLRDRDLIKEHIPSTLATFAFVQRILLISIVTILTLIVIISNIQVDLEILFIIFVTIGFQIERQVASVYLLANKNIAANTWHSLTATLTAHIPILLAIHFSGDILYLYMLASVGNISFFITTLKYRRLALGSLNFEFFNKLRQRTILSAVFLQILQEIAQRLEVIILAAVMDLSVVGYVNRSLAIMSAFSNLLINPIKEYSYIYFHRNTSMTNEKFISISVVTVFILLHVFILLLKFSDLILELTFMPATWKLLPEYILLCLPLFITRNFRKLFVNYLGAKQAYNFMILTQIFYVSTTAIIITIFDLKNVEIVLWVQSIIMYAVIVLILLKLATFYRVTILERIIYSLMPLSFLPHILS